MTHSLDWIAICKSFGDGHFASDVSSLKMMLGVDMMFSEIPKPVLLSAT